MKRSPNKQQCNIKHAKIYGYMTDRASMLRYKTGLAWFSRLSRHPARKWSGSILTTQEPARGYTSNNISFCHQPVFLTHCSVILFLFISTLPRPYNEDSKQ